MSNRHIHFLINLHNVQYCFHVLICWAVDARCTNSLALHRATVVSRARVCTARLADDVSRWVAQVRQRRERTLRVRSTSESRKLQSARERQKRKKKKKRQNRMVRSPHGRKLQSAKERQKEKTAE